MSLRTSARQRDYEDELRERDECLERMLAAWAKHGVVAAQPVLVSEAFREGWRAANGGWRALPEDQERDAA